MNAKDAIRSSTNISSMVLKSYISDLDDADLMLRPGEGCNHLAWQLGHLISSEVRLLESVAPGQAVELPEGFAEAHSKDHCGSDDPAGFQTKASYVELFDKVRAASLSALDSYESLTSTTRPQKTSASSVRPWATCSPSSPPTP